MCISVNVVVLSKLADLEQGQGRGLTDRHTHDSDRMGQAGLPQQLKYDLHYNNSIRQTVQLC